MRGRKRFGEEGKEKERKERRRGKERSGDDGIGEKRGRDEAWSWRGKK